MSKRLIGMLFSFAALLAFTSCAEQESGEDVVVAILKDGTSDYMKQLKSSIEAECLAKGCKALIITTKGEYDIESQLQAAKSLASLDYNVKGIIFIPIYDPSNKNEAESIINSFAGKSIPVVFLDTKPSELSPMKDSYYAYVGVDLQVTGTAFAGMIPETDPSKILSIHYNTVATMERYRIFKDIKGITGEQNAISVTADNELDAEKLNDKLSGLSQGGSVVLFNGDFYNKILTLGTDVQNLDDKQIYAFDAYRELLDNIKNGGNVKSVQAQNSFVMGKKSVDCIFSAPDEKDIFVPCITISSATINSEEVKPFLEFFGL